MDFYFDTYSELSLQRFMVSDKPRTDAFAAAIDEVITGGERVLDIGTGTGLLALLAAKAGAKQVYALDQATVAEVARMTVEKNKLSDVIDVIHGNASDFQLAEPVDLIVSEWLGHFAFAEAMLDDVIACRDENLKPGGVMLPSDVKLFLAPLDSSLLYDEEGPGYWKEPVHGIDFAHLESLELEQAIAIKTIVMPEDLLAPAQAILSLDLATAGVDDPWASGELVFRAGRSGRLDGFAGWFTAQLSPSVLLDTGPEQPTTHWRQTYFPFPPMQIEKGQQIALRFALSKHPVEPRGLELKLSVGSIDFTYTVG